VSGLIGSLRRFLRSALLLSFVLAFFRHVVRDRDLLIQLCRPDFQNESNPHHEFKGDHALAAFDAADILPVKIAQLSQPLLREVAASPQLLQLFAEQNQGAGHAVRVLRQASNVKPHAGLRPVWCYTILLPTWLRLYQRFGTSLVLLRTTAFIPADTPTQVSAMPWTALSRMAGALFGRSIPGRIDRFIRENSSTSLRHCRPCPGVTVIKLKVARSPFRLR